MRRAQKLLFDEARKVRTLCAWGALPYTWKKKTLFLIYFLNGLLGFRISIIEQYKTKIREESFLEKIKRSRV